MRFAMVYSKIKVQNLEMVNLKCVICQQPIHLSDEDNKWKESFSAQHKKDACSGNGPERYEKHECRGNVVLQAVIQFTSRNVLFTI